MKNKNRQSIFSKISQKSNLPLDMLTNLPLIQVFSNREALIEDAGALIYYDDKKISLIHSKVPITFTGQNLKIHFLSNGDLRISGCIDTLIFDTERTNDIECL